MEGRPCGTITGSNSYTSNRQSRRAACLEPASKRELFRVVQSCRAIVAAPQSCGPASNYMFNVWLAGQGFEKSNTK